MILINSENLFQKACRLFPYHDMASRRVTQRMRVKWLRSVKVLGNKWIMATQTIRKEILHV